MIRIKDLEKKVDERGFLVEVIKDYEVGKKFGQFMVTTAKPGKVKGNHYHKRKHEYYCVIKGKCKLAVVDNKTGKREEVILSGDRPQLVTINPNVSHAVQNVGSVNMYLLIYIDESFDPSDPDTFRSKVL